METVVADAFAANAYEPIRMSGIVYVCLFGTVITESSSSVIIGLYTGYVSNIIITVNEGFVKSFVVFSR